MRHLKEKNVGYFTHMFCAIKYSLRLYLASQILVVHAVFPNLFETTATDIIKSILQETENAETE